MMVYTRLMVVSWPVFDSGLVADVCEQLQGAGEPGHLIPGRLHALRQRRERRQDPPSSHRSRNIILILLNIKNI